MKKVKEERIKKDGVLLSELLMYNEPDVMIETQYGNIPYLKWLEKEKERIESDPKRVAEIVTAKGGEVALFVNDDF